MLSQSIVSGSVPPAAVLGIGIEVGVLAFGPDGNPTAKNIFASTVAGGGWIAWSRRRFSW